jgi:O-antigen biosynthesis protein
MVAGSANGQVWLFRDVLVARCDARALADARRVDVRCAGVRPKVLQRRVVELEDGGQALIILLRDAAATDAVREIELQDAAGRTLARLPRQQPGTASAPCLDALLQGVREADALGILRGILATSRAATWRGTGASFGSTFARMVDFLSQPEAAATRPAAPPAAEARPAGTARSEIHVLRADAATLLDGELLLVSGHAPWPLAPSGRAWLGERERRPVPVRCLSLDHASGEAGFAFVAMVRSPELRAGPPEQLALASGGRRFRLLLGAPLCDRGAALLDLVRAHDPEALTRVTDFLVAPLPRAVPPIALGPEAQALLRDLLLAAGHSIGVIEIAGVIAGHGLMVQGWSRHRPGARRHVIGEGAGCGLRRALFATFAREDLGGDGCGFIGLIEGPDLKAPGELRRVHLREGAGWSHLDWLEQGQRLAADVTHAHLRAMLPRLDPDAATLRRLRRIANGGFDGRDTISSLERPVRIGLDFALLAAGTGLFLGGWLLDPTRIVDCVTLRSTAGLAADLGQHWTRTARPDLNEAFGADPLLGPHLSPDAVRHGFMAFVPLAGAPARDEELYLEVVLNDDAVRFMPVAATRRHDPATVRRLLASFDRNDPAASRLIERQIGPFVAASGGAPQLAPDQINVLDPARPHRRPQRALVVPLGPSVRDFDVNLATFAVDPDFAATQIVVVAPAALGGPAISALWHQAGFYGLNLRLVVTQQTLDPCAALEVGAGHAECETLVFLSAATFARQRGWLGELCRRFRELGRPALISPTLLYEDDSIKFAGLCRRAAASLQAAEAMTSAFAGYPREWLQGKDLTPVLAATTECCVLSRATLRRLDGFSPEFVAPDLKSTDFMLKARVAGIASFWLPSVEMVALDERFDDEGAYWFRNRLVVDQWSFGRKWQAYLAEGRESA